MEEYVLVRFSKKTGKIDIVMESITKSMLKLWALQNTTKTKDTIIFSEVTGDVVFYAEGTADFPEVKKENLGNIEDYCKGLLAAVQDN